MICTTAATSAVTAGLAAGGAVLFAHGSFLAADSAGLAGQALELGQGSWSAILAWLDEGFVTAPAVMAGLAALLVVPVVALAGGIAARIERRLAMRRARTSAIVVPPQQATLRIEGEAAPRRLACEMLRIGRQDDNDLCLPSTSVHRYHAVIHRTPEAAFMITDLSGPGGRGIRVNGERIAQTRLLDGDRIDVGGVTLTFGMQS